MNSYCKETIFHIPGAFRMARGCMRLLDLVQENPDILKDNVKIGSFYGSPQCIWNGGRLVQFSMTPIALEQIRKYINNFNIPIRLTFTNCLLLKEHTSDKVGNELLEIFSKGSNEIICNSDILETYIRNKYGDKYNYISSTTKRLSDKALQLDELDKDYSLVVLDYDHNKDFKFLEQIKDKDRCELLCNAVCKTNCPLREEHYKKISQAQLTNDRNQLMFCKDAYRWFWEVQNSDSFISVDDINDIYLPLGYSNFKLEGRTAHAMDWIEIILYYLIKDEYKLEVRAKLQQVFLMAS